MTAHEGFTADDDGGDNSSFATSFSSSSSFQYRVSHREGATWIAIRGAVEDEDRDAFRKALLPRVDSSESGESSDKQKAVDIALDLGEVAYLSETAVAVLIQLLKAQRAQGASLHLVRLSPWVRKKFERTAIIQFFTLSD